MEIELSTVVLAGMVAVVGILAVTFLVQERRLQASGEAADEREAEWHACAVRQSRLECRKLEAEIDAARRASEDRSPPQTVTSVDETRAAPILPSAR